MTIQKKSLLKPYDEAVFEVSKRVTALQTMNMMVPVDDANQAKILEDCVSHLQLFWVKMGHPVEKLRALLFDIPLHEEWTNYKVCTYIWSHGIIF